MARFQYPYEITKLYAIKEKEPDKVDTSKNYAFAVQENFDMIQKYLNEIIDADNIVANSITGGTDGCLAITTITNNNIVQNTITGGTEGNLALITITGDNIVLGTITPDLLFSGLPTFQSTIPGILTVGANQPPATPVPCEVIAIQLYAYVKVAPSSSSLIVEINNNDISIGTVTIDTGNHSSSATISELLSLNDVITVDINQADGVVADLTVQVRT